MRNKEYTQQILPWILFGWGLRFGFMNYLVNYFELSNDWKSIMHI